MNILIAGGSGQIGQLLAAAFHDGGHEVTVLTRSAVQNTAWRTCPWDGVELGPWTEALNRDDVLINLAGRSVNCRYNQANRSEILNSRVSTTRLLARAIAAAKSPPKLWLQASTATLYAHTFDRPNGEINGVIGGAEPNAPDTWRFSIQVAKSWEAAATEFALPHTRLVLLRSAMVMTADKGGVFDQLLQLTRQGLGGTAGDGEQYISWIHGADFIRAIEWIIAKRDLIGPVNIASPNPLPNADFMRSLRRACGKRWGLSAPPWMLEIGAWFMRTETELILKSRRVVPTRLLESGFTFHNPTWPEAAVNLWEEWQKRHITSLTKIR